MYFFSFTKVIRPWNLRHVSLKEKGTVVGESNRADTDRWVHRRVSHPVIQWFYWPIVFFLWANELFNKSANIRKNVSDVMLIPIAHSDLTWMSSVCKKVWTWLYWWLFWCQFGGCFWIFASNIGRSQGHTNGTLSLYECRLSGADIQEVGGDDSSPSCHNLIYLTFLHPVAVRMLKHLPSDHSCLKSHLVKLSHSIHSYTDVCGFFKSQFERMAQSVKALKHWVCVGRRWWFNGLEKCEKNNERINI